MFSFSPLCCKQPAQVDEIHDMPFQIPLFSIEKVSPNLKDLALCSKDALKILNGGCLENNFQKVEVLRLHHFDETPVTFLNGFHAIFPNVVTLQVRASSFETLFLTGGIDHLNSQSLKQIKNLFLFELEQLRFIWQEDFSVGYSLVQDLKNLNLRSCPSLICLAPSSLPLNNLTDLEVDNCIGLVYLITTETAKSLVQLTKLVIGNCEKMLDVVKVDQEKAEEEIIFENLEILELSSLLSLRSFCNGIVYGVRKAVQNCVWLGLVLIAWHFLFDKRVQRETNSDVLQYVTKVLVCFLVGTLVWLLKTLVVKVLASSFHVSTYFDRIQESLFNQFVIETLSGPPLVEIRKAEEEEERLADEVQKLQNAGVSIPADLRASAFPNIKSGRLRSGMLQKSPVVKSGKFSMPLSKKSDDNGIGNGGGGITIDHLHKLNPNNVSAWNMKRLMNMVRHGALTTLDEQILDSSADDEHATQIRSENEAKAAAKKIFQNVARRGCRFIYPEDLMRFMREDEAIKTINLFEGASDSGKISKSALKNWVVNAFRERRALALTLNDTKTAVNKLHRMLNFLVAIIILVIWLLILEIATTKFLLFVSSQLVLVAFIFGNTCKTVFEAIIFLFVMHPFDVGDRCEIDATQMVVEEMNILTTVFLRFDNQKITIPNSVLATKAIHNFYRSPDMGDSIEFCIHVATPPEKISLMKHRIHNFIDNKKEHWYPSPFIVLKDHEQLNMVKVAIWPTHRMNFQDMGERYIRRSLLIEELMKIFRDLDIQYRLMPLDINVRALPTTSDRLPASWTTITN